MYTQLTDVENELNGLITYDRRVIKLSPADVKRIVNMPEIKLKPGRRWVWRSQMNLYYTGDGGAARAFAAEMAAGGVVDEIRAEAGNLRYEYFLPHGRPGDGTAHRQLGRTRPRSTRTTPRP